MNLIKINYSIRQLIVFVLIFICNQSFSANRFWVDTGSGLWNSPTNWSDVSGGTTGFSVPSATDIANFDGGNINNCVINTNINVAGFNITGFYTGTISVNTGITTTIGASGFSQEAGIFTGNNGNISINGAFLLAGGVFNAPTEVIQITGGYTYSGGKFNHHNGTVSFSMTQTISGSTSFYNILFAANGGIYTIANGTTLSSVNNVTISGSTAYVINTGIVEIKGDLTLEANQNNISNGGTATFLFNGTGVQNITSFAPSANYACALPNIEINKSAGALNLAGFINFNGSSWNTKTGSSLVNPGTSVVNLLKTTTLSGQDLSLYDIVVTGNNSTTTISAGVTWSSTHLITLAGGTSWYQLNSGTLNAKGDVLVTNTNNSFNVGGNAILLFDGTDNQTLTGSGIVNAGRLPRVQINKTGGILTLSSNIISMDNNWTYIAGAVDARTNASSVDFYKTSNIDGQGISSTMAFYHVIISGLITLGGNMDVNGDFTIRAGTGNRLDVSALNNYQLNIAGYWVNNNSVTASSFNQQNGKVVFDGTRTQAITTGSSSDIETFYKLEINKTRGFLILEAPITISNNVNFVVGNILSSSAHILLINNAATATGTSRFSFVSGPVRKTGNQAFTFPVGMNAVYAPIAISAPTVNTHQFTAQYFHTDPNPSYDVTSKDASLVYVSRCEYWILDRTIGTSNVTVRLSWDTLSCGIMDLPDLRVAQWDGSQWKDHGNGGTTGTMTTGTIVSSSVVSTFSPFTLASISRPLPVELIDFNGECQGMNAVISWITASEANNDYFMVERSTDAINWKNIGTVDGAGNSAGKLNYVYTDTQPNNEIFYYRLKQTDLDGKFEYSKYVVVADCINEISELVIYPNPAQEIIYFLFNGEKEHVRSIDIYNILGERISTFMKYQPSIDLSANKSGIYTVRINLGSKIITKNIVLEK